MNHRHRIPWYLATVTACAIAGAPAFPPTTTARLVGPRCDRSGQPCQCDGGDGQVGEPPDGFRRFEVRLPPAQSTASALVIDGIGALVRDQANPAGSCFYLDLLVGSTYQVRYLAQAEHRDRGVVAAFSLREAAPAGAGWYDVIHQSCGSRDEPCHYESPADWTAAIRGGHRFHDECGSTELDNINIEGGLYDRRFIDVQFTFDLLVRSDEPEGPPGSRCRPRLNLAPEEPPPRR